MSRFSPEILQQRVAPEGVPECGKPLLRVALAKPADQMGEIAGLAGVIAARRADSARHRIRGSSSARHDGRPARGAADAAGTHGASDSKPSSPCSMTMMGPSPSAHSSRRKSHIRELQDPLLEGSGAPSGCSGELGRIVWKVAAYEATTRLGLEGTRANGARRSWIHCRGDAR